MVAERAVELGVQGACLLLWGRLAAGLPSSHRRPGDEPVCSPTTATMVSCERDVREGSKQLVAQSHEAGCFSWSTVEGGSNRCAGKSVQGGEEELELFLDQAGLDQISASLCFPTGRQQGESAVAH